MLTRTKPSSSSFALTWLQRLSPSNTNYVGIDIGVDYVKVATLGAKRESAHPSSATEFGWLSRAAFSLPIDPASGPQPDWVELVAQVLQDRLPRCVDDERNLAVISLPTPWIHYQTTPESDLETTQHQCDTMFGSSIFRSNAHLTAWPAINGKEQLVVAATAEAAARRIANAIASVGYQVQGILPHGVALLMAAPALTSLNPWAVLLLERTGGLVAIQNDRGCGLCRNLPPCAITTPEQPYLNEIEPWLHEIASEVDATSRYASRLSGHYDKDSPVLICGRAAQIAGVDTTIASVLHRPVATWRYAGRHRPPHRASLLDAQHSDASMAISLSLACCGLRGTATTWRGTS